MTIEEMKSKKIELGLTNEMIAQASGLPLSTIQKVLSGTTKAPRRSTLEAMQTVLLAEDLRRRKAIVEQDEERLYYEKKNEETAHSYTLSGRIMPGILREPALAYGTSPKKEWSPEQLRLSKKGGYTLDDYYALPEDMRVELIDGDFYVMLAPAFIHQKILGDLHILFRECIDAHEMDCEVFLSPCDVRLDRDNRTMVEPDLLVICGGYDLGAQHFDGAPDLTLEILSPSTRAKDMLLKLHKYQHAGVKEYWIVDPDKETVLVYDFRNDDLYPEKYSFTDVIPIHISDGACSIDFAKIQRSLQKAREREKAGK